MSRLLAFALLLAPVALVPVASFAQTASTSTVVGTVKDSAGAVVPGAKVRVVQVETQFISDTVASGDGHYRIAYLPPGNYRLTVEAPGFKAHVQEGLYFRAAETPRVDVTLEVGSLTESVTVTGAAPLLQTESAAAGTTYQGETILRIPIPAKRTLRALFFFPNTSGTRILGQRQNEMAFVLDGVSAKAPGLANVNETDATVQTAPEAYQEVKVHTTGMPAEIGHAAGGMMSMVYKSGSNDFHGSTEVRWQNQPMVHRAWLQQLRNAVPYTYGEYSASATGPVMIPKLYNGRNKTFFLFTYTLQDEKFNNTVNTAVPTEAMLNGDFSFRDHPQGGFAIYNPYSTRLVNGAYTRDPFPGNIIPKSLYDPAVVNFLSRTPWRAANNVGIPSRSGPSSNLITVTDRTKLTYRHRMDFKVDQQFGSNNRAYVRVSPTIHRADRDNPDMRLTFNGDGSLIDQRQQPFPLNFWNFLVSDVHVLSPSMTNEIRFGGNHRIQFQTVNSLDQDWAGQLGIPNVSPVTFPYLNAGYGLSNLSNRKVGGDDFVLQDNVSKIAGKHTFKIGYEVTRTWYNSALSDNQSGIYNFDSAGTGLPNCTASGCNNTPNTGQQFASFLLGAVSSAQFTQSNATWLPRWWSHQWYVQDDWKLARNLTLNIGLRWSYESPFQTKYGQQSQFDPDATDPLTGRRGAITHTAGPLAKKDLNNFAPRFGLAWNFTPKTVFRGSFGIVHADIFMANTENIMFQEYQALANVQAPPGEPNVAFRLSQGPPAIRYSVQPGGYSPFIGTNYSQRDADRWDPNMRMPYVMSWTAGFQYEIKRDHLVELQYLGQGGVGLINGRNINQIPLSVYATESSTALNSIFSNQQAALPYPHFGTVRLYSNFGHNTYHGMNVRFERRYSSGLAYNIYYTFSKTINDADGGGNANGVDYYNRRLDKGLASYDIRHRTIGLLQYSLPFGRDRKWLNKGVSNALLGGWDLTWSQTIQSGQPFSVTYSNNPSRQLPGGGVQRPNIVAPNFDAAMTPGWSGVGENRYPFSAQVPYLLDSAFAYPGAFTVGNLGRNTFRGPGIGWAVTSLVKWINIGERLRAQVGLDGLNFPWKQPNYNNPSSTFNTSNNATFGRITGYTVFNNVGSSQANWQLRTRLEW